MKLKYSSLALGMILATTIGCEENKKIQVSNQTENQSMGKKYVQLEVPSKDGGMTTVEYPYDFMKNDTIHGFIPLEEAVKYDERFFKYYWHSSNGAYDDESTSEALKNIYKAGYSAQEANSFPPNFRATEIYDALKVGLTAKYASNYDEFSKTEIINCFKAGLQWEIANKYDQKLKNADVVVELYSKGFTPDEANHYLKYISAQEISQALILGLEPNDLKGYHDSFTVRDIEQFRNENVSREYANQFAKLNEKIGTDYNSNEIVSFKKNNVSSKYVTQFVELNNTFGTNYDSNEIISFKKGKVPFNKIRETIVDKFILDSAKDKE